MIQELRRALVGLAVIAASTVAVSVTVAIAAETDGTIDLGYGSSGVVSFAGQFRDPLALSDGKVVMFSSIDTYASNGTISKVEIKRFTTAGALDTTFGLNGTMTIQPSGHTYIAYSYAFADSSGGFYVVYTSNDPNVSPSTYDAGKMWKITSAGVQDLNFGTSGETRVPAVAGSQQISSQWIDATSGNMYLIQHGNVSTIVKQNSSGVPDTTFGANSKAYIDWPYNGGCSKFWRAVKMAIWVDPSETYALVAAFIEQTGSTTTLGIAKLNFSSRSCDITFGGDYYLSNGTRGTDSTPDGFFELDIIPGASSLSGTFNFQTDGSLVVQASNDSSELRVAKVTSATAFDTGFNTTGISDNLWSSLSAGFSSHPNLVTLSDGSIRLVGKARTGGTWARILGLTSAGALDSSVGTNGIKDSTQCSNIGQLTGSLRLTDGSVIATSFLGTGSPTVYNTYLVKLGSSGSASQCGTTTTTTTTTQPSGGGSCSGGASISPSSRTGIGNVGQPMSIPAPNLSGYSTSPTFTLSNNSYFPPGLNLLPNGEITGTPTSSATGMTSGITVSNGSQSCFYSVTFQITGSSTPCVAGAPSSTNSAVTFDTSFSTDGVYQFMNQSDSPAAVDSKPGPDGTVVVAAMANMGTGGSPTNSSSNFYRMRADGTLDPSWGTGGVANIDVNSSTTYGENVANVVVLPDGSAVASIQVYIAGMNAVQETRLAKLTAAGVFDTSFGNSGFATIYSGPTVNSVYPRNLLIGQSGSLYLAGSTSGGSSNLKIYKVLADGSLDSTFATNGILTIASSYSAIATDGTGNLFIAGRTSTSPADATIVKYSTSGTIDTSFGTNGQVVFNTSQGSSESVGAIALADGKITAVVRTSSGQGNTPTYTESAVRIDTNGSFDSSFGTDGIAPLATGSVQTLGIEVLSDGSALLSGMSLGVNDFRWVLSGITSDGSSVGTLVASPAAISSGACVLSDATITVLPSGVYVAGSRYPSDQGPVSGFIFKIVVSGVSSGGGSSPTTTTPATPVPTLVTEANAASLVQAPGSESIIVDGVRVTIETNSVDIPAARVSASQRTAAQVAAVQAAGAALLQQFLASLPAGATSTVTVENTPTGAVIRNLVVDANGNSLDVPVEDIVFLDGPQISLMIGSSNANITADGKYQVGAGGIIGVAGSGMGVSQSGEMIVMSTPTLLANFTTTAQGELNKSAELPSSIGVGDHTLVVATGSTYVLMGIRVVPSGLPSTGSSGDRIVIFALFTLVMGVVFLRSRRTYTL